MPFLVGGTGGISVPRRGGGGFGFQFERAPDGNTYFAVLGPSIHLIRGLRYLAEAQQMYMRYPHAEGKAQAAAIGVIMRELETAVAASGVRTAQFAEERAKSLLERRLVRPATPRPSHLVDAIVARSIPTRSLAGGAVGIGDISVLDTHPYWKAQEFGSEHMVGKVLRGYFFDAGGGRHAPDPSQRRKHPIFSPMSGPTMRVENPIRGKGFLTEATFEALGYRYRIWRGVEQAAVSQMRLVRSGAHPDVARARRRIGGFASIVKRPPRIS